MEQTQVVTRSGKREPVSFDKITTRIQQICSWKLDSNSKNNILTSDWCDPITSIDTIDISKKYVHVFIMALTHQN